MRSRRRQPSLSVVVPGPKFPHLPSDHPRAPWAFYRTASCGAGVVVRRHRGGRLEIRPQRCRASGCRECHAGRRSAALAGLDGMRATKGRRWYLTTITPPERVRDYAIGRDRFLERVRALVGELVSEGVWDGAYAVVEVATGDRWTTWAPFGPVRVSKHSREPCPARRGWHLWAGEGPPLEDVDGEHAATSARWFVAALVALAAGQPAPPRPPDPRAEEIDEWATAEARIAGERWRLACEGGTCEICEGAGVIPVGHLHVHLLVLARPFWYGRGPAPEWAAGKGIRDFTLPGGAEHYPTRWTAAPDRRYRAPREPWDPVPLVFDVEGVDVDAGEEPTTWTLRRIAVPHGVVVDRRLSRATIAGRRGCCPLPPREPRPGQLPPLRQDWPPRAPRMGPRLAPEVVARVVASRMAPAVLEQVDRYTAAPVSRRGGARDYLEAHGFRVVDFRQVKSKDAARAYLSKLVRDYAAKIGKGRNDARLLGAWMAGRRSGWSCGKVYGLAGAGRRSLAWETVDLLADPAAGPVLVEPPDEDAAEDDERIRVRRDTRAWRAVLAGSYPLDLSSGLKYLHATRNTAHVVGERFPTVMVGDSLCGPEDGGAELPPRTLLGTIARGWSRWLRAARWRVVEEDGTEAGLEPSTWADWWDETAPILGLPLAPHWWRPAEGTYPVRRAGLHANHARIGRLLEGVDQLPVSAAGRVVGLRPRARLLVGRRIAVVGHLARSGDVELARWFVGEPGRVVRGPRGGLGDVLEPPERAPPSEADCRRIARFWLRQATGDPWPDAAGDPEPWRIADVLAVDLSEYDPVVRRSA